MVLHRPVELADKTRNSTWSIRRATSADRNGVDGLQKRQHRPSRSDSVILEYFVAVSDDRIIGCAAVRKGNNVGYLYGLVVDKPWRRRGIGHALTEKRLDWLRDENVRSVFVMAMFWNIRFFKKHDFTLANKREVDGLAQLHSDFRDAWSNRSALLFLGLPSRMPPAEGAGREDEESTIQS
jgi:N-acetylglutamate synthase-like GNAT family acetyltransferase